MNIGLIGTGAYGQAMAMMLLKNNNNVVMWTENEDKYKFYKENNRIKSLINGVEIPKEIKLTNDIKEACLDKDIIFIMTTAHYVGKICDEINPYITKKTIVCIASKGIENVNCKFLSDIAYEKLKTKHIAIISGPSFAVDMANSYPVGLSIASLSKKSIKLIKQSLVSDSVKLRETSDLIGVQICGSIKNVIALAAGMLDGMNYPESTQSFLITESLNDIKELIKSSVKQSFLEYFILVESFTSLCLKELKLYKISDDMNKSLNKLYESKIITEDLYLFLNQYRRYRNRIAHVYKQPSIEEIIEFVKQNRDNINEVLNIMINMYKG